MAITRGVNFPEGWLRREMDLRLLTNRRLAEAAGVSSFTVSQACNGTVSKKSADAILRALKRFRAKFPQEEGVA